MSDRERRNRPDRAGRRFFRPLAYIGYLLVLPLIVMEVGLRLAYALLVGPDIVLYGIKQHYSPSLLRGENDRQTHSVQFHDNTMPGYTKYLPQQIRTDHDQHGSRFRVAINAQGFRGSDFMRAKGPSTIRVATVGGSSTFGYYARDDETYPAHLQTALNRATVPDSCDPRSSWEVLNFGIPHLRARNVAQLLQNEVLAYSPDVIVFYGGMNDAAEIGTRFLQQGRESAAWRLFETAANRSISVGLVKSIYEGRLRTRGVALHQVRDAAAASDFLVSLEAMRVAAEKSGAIFIVASQQAKSKPGGADGDLRGVRYEEEVQRVQADLQTREGLRPNELFLLIHDELMRELRQWAVARRVPFVDVIELTNDRRDVLLSWVHLSPEGNKAVAEALVPGIRRARCEDRVRRPAADGQPHPSAPAVSSK